jgi:hypothetical protein
MVSRERLKQEIDTLNESQLSRIAEFIVSVKAHPRQSTTSVRFWQRATPLERSQDFRAWVVGLPGTGSTLPDEAFDRESIYE